MLFAATLASMLSWSMIRGGNLARLLLFTATWFELPGGAKLAVPLVASWFECSRTTPRRCKSSTSAVNYYGSRLQVRVYLSRRRTTPRLMLPSRPCYSPYPDVKSLLHPRGGLIALLGDTTAARFRALVRSIGALHRRPHSAQNAGIPWLALSMVRYEGTRRLMSLPWHDGDPFPQVSPSRQGV